MNFANLTKPGVIPPVPERFRVQGMRRKNLGMTSDIAHKVGETVYGEPFAVRCELEIQHMLANGVSPERDVLMMVVGGITGFESMVLDEHCLKTLGTTSWCANAGGMGWDELCIDQENMAALRKWVDENVAFRDIGAAPQDRITAELVQNDTHAHVKVWVNGALSGKLTFLQSEAQTFTDWLRFGAKQQGCADAFQMEGTWSDLYGK